MSRQVIINWGISSYYGWGVYGLNLALEWASDPEIRSYCSLPIADGEVAIDPLRRRALAPFGRRSLTLLNQLQSSDQKVLYAQAALLHCLDQKFEPLATVEKVVVLGEPTIGVTFFNDTVLSPDAVVRAASYPAMVAGSTWNQQVLEAYGLTNVRRIIQGIDPTLFHAGPRQGVMSDRFLVFSGGKLERRKGQDIVVAAFAKFVKRRPDALLVTAWQSPWPVLARTLDDGGVAAPLVMNGEVTDVTAWAQANGIPAANVLDLGVIPNPQMPPVLREMDVAVFPNRSEGGTNLVAMEAMACGVPTILSRNTGHLDLIEDDNCYTLDQQGVLTGLEAPYKDVAGWGESDVDELVELLDRAYVDREDARQRGLKGAKTLARMSWAATAAQMKSLIWELS